MSASDRILRLRFDLPKREGVGESSVLVYQVADGFSLVVTVEHDGDAEVFLSGTEFAELQQKLAEIQSEP